MGWGLLGERGIEPIISPMYFVFRFCFLCAFVLRVFFFSYFWWCCRYVSTFDTFFVVQIFYLRSSPVPEFVLIFVAISPVIGLLWNFRGQLNDVYSENLKLLISDLLGYPRPARKNSNGPCDLDIWPIHTSSHASDHLVSNREIIHTEQYMM